jgi:hypothetical protein
MERYIEDVGEEEEEEKKWNLITSPLFDCRQVRGERKRAKPQNKRLSGRSCRYTYTARKFFLFSLSFLLCWSRREEV